MSGAFADPNAEPQLTTEVQRLPYGAEMVTIFAQSPGDEAGQAADLPLVAVLRDRLNENDPSAGRLRQVWVFTYTRPSIVQRMAAAFPFFFHRSIANRGSSGQPPTAVMDLSAPHRGSIEKLLGLTLQARIFDPSGMLIRTSTRTYQGNAREYERIHVQQALSALSQLDPSEPGSSGLTAPELRAIQARLSLDKRFLGGFVRNSQLDEVYENVKTQAQIGEQRNWELLRQRAEQNGLYFQPLALGQSQPGQALLWIAKEDLENGGERRFDATLLSLSDPWKDEHLRHWKGFTDTWFFDADGRKAEASGAGTRALHMIPLALYSLQYPRAPLLLVDFRSEWQPKRRELSRRTADAIASGVLGFNGLSNLGYFAAKASWKWFHGRHGQAVDRNSRLDAYAELQHALLLDSLLNPVLKKEIIRRLEGLALNPFEQDSECETELARRQYAALAAYVQNPEGLEAALARARGRELVAFSHGATARTFLTFASIATLGAFRHREEVTTDSLARLDRGRRIQARVNFLEHVLASSPQIDVVWDMAEIRNSLDELAGLEAGRSNGSVSQLVARVFAGTSDEDTRRECLRCLYRLNSTPARQELSRLSQDQLVSAELRADCDSYLRGTPPSYGIAAAAGSGQ